MKKSITVIALIFGMFAAAIPAFAEPVEIQLWHPALGPLDATLKSIIDGFNRKQSDFRVVDSARGTYEETMNAGIAAYRSGKQPHMLIVIGQGTLSMLNSGAIYPVHDLLKDNGFKVDWNRFIQPVLNYYRSTDGRLLSLPFSVSTPILWYNKDAYKKAGLSGPPATWEELGQQAAKLKAAGYECGYATAWQQWVLIDNYAVMHNLPVATEANGADGLGARFVFNRGSIVTNLARIQEWAKDGRFLYTGRQGATALAAFMGGRCAIISHSSAIFAGLKSATFDVGAAFMPMEEGVTPHNSLIGGGSIWVMKGRKKSDYKGVAAFLNYLTDVNVQAAWHEQTGYVPLTLDAYEKVKGEGYYAKYPVQEVAIQQLLRGDTPATPNTRTVRLGGSTQYVTVIEEELEAIWSGKKTAQQAMDDAVRRGDEVLRRYESQYKK